MAGGVESMSLIPMMGHKVVAGRRLNELHPAAYLGMGMTAENVAVDYRVSREDQDRFALESNQKAVNAIASGWFRDEIVPVTVTSRLPKEGGQVAVKQVVVDTDVRVPVPVIG